MTLKHIIQWRREHGVPDYVPFPSVGEMVEHQPKRDYVFGIGAYDRMVIDMTDVTEWTPDEELPWYEAGELYAMARRGANEMRSRAYRRMVL
jgi:hypothetical protein